MLFSFRPTNYMSLSVHPYFKTTPCSLFYLILQVKFLSLRITAINFSRLSFRSSLLLSSFVAVLGVMHLCSLYPSLGNKSISTDVMVLIQVLGASTVILISVQNIAVLHHLLQSCLCSNCLEMPTIENDIYFKWVEIMMFSFMKFQVPVKEM